jgi:hypothetical protein
MLVATGGRQIPFPASSSTPRVGSFKLIAQLGNSKETYISYIDISLRYRTEFFPHAYGNFLFTVPNAFSVQ